MAGVYREVSGRAAADYAGAGRAAKLGGQEYRQAERDRNFNRLVLSSLTHQLYNLLSLDRAILMINNNISSYFCHSFLAIKMHYSHYYEEVEFLPCCHFI